MTLELRDKPVEHRCRKCGYAGFFDHDEGEGRGIFFCEQCGGAFCARHIKRIEGADTTFTCYRCYAKAESGSD